MHQVLETKKNDRQRDSTEKVFMLIAREHILDCFEVKHDRAKVVECFALRVTLGYACESRDKEQKKYVIRAVEDLMSRDFFYGDKSRQLS